MTTAEPPTNAQAIEMKVIAEDSSGNQRAIDLVLDPKELKQQTDTPNLTRAERREAREERRLERQEAREQRQVERQARIEARQEQRAEKRAAREITRSGTDVSVLSDGRVRFAESLIVANEGALKLMRMVTDDTSLTIEITDDAKESATIYEVRLKNGDAVPDWVQVDAETGELLIEAPQDADMIELTLIATGGSEQRAIDIEVDLAELGENDETQNAGDDAQSGVFIPLDSQIDDALADGTYGQDLQNAMQSRV
jgi:hypothetical protein